MLRGLRCSVSRLSRGWGDAIRSWPESGQGLDCDGLRLSDALTWGNRACVRVSNRAREASLKDERTGSDAEPAADALLMKQLIPAAERFADDLVSLRRDLHRYPELSFR